MKEATKEIIKKTIVESLTLIFILIVLGLTIYLQALVKQDTITLYQAEIFSYITLGFIIFFLILVLIIEKGQEIISRRKDDLIENLEKELERLKNRD